MVKKQRDYSKLVKEFYNLGVLRKDEDIDAFEQLFNSIDLSKKSQYSKKVDGFMFSGYAILTKQRLIIMDTNRKAILYSWDLDQIISVGQKRRGLFEKRVKSASLSIKSGEEVIKIILGIDYGETFFNQVIQNKKDYSKIKSVKIDTLVIQEGKDEEALAILKKRLARGEITLEEFHQIVQRL